MKTRWLAAGIAALLVTGGALTVAQRVITRMTRGVLPEKNDSAHPDSRQVAKTTPSLSPQPKSSPLIQASIGESISPSADSPLPAEAGPGLPAAGSSTSEGAMDSRVIAVEPAAPPVVIANEISEVRPPIVLASTDVAITPASGSPLPETRMVTTEAEPAQDVPGKLDPVASVETFVERNRKEAESAIQTLTVEAETLKARLAKVETALTRWQSFSRALNADQPASQPVVGPGSKPGWIRPSPEGSPQTTRAEGNRKPVGEPSPDLTPVDQPPEPSPKPSVPTPTDAPATPAATDPKPTELPATDPPGLPLPATPSTRDET